MGFVKGVGTFFAASILGLFVLVAIGALTSGDKSNSEVSMPSPSLTWVQGSDALKASLRDPDSAKILSGFVSSDAGKYFACGTVNAKNGFGGYSGATRWFSDSILVAVESAAIAQEFEAGWQSHCTNEIQSYR